MNIHLAVHSLFHPYGRTDQNERRDFKKGTFQGREVGQVLWKAKVHRATKRQTIILNTDISPETALSITVSTHSLTNS